MGRTRLIINIPHDQQNNWQNTLEYLRGDAGRFGCADLGTMVEHLGRRGLAGRTRDLLNRAAYSFLLWETDRTDINRLIEQIESRHNDPTFSRQGVGFVKYVEREPTFTLGQVEPEVELGTNFTFDQHWLNEYRNNLMGVGSTPYDGSGVRIAVIDTGVEPHTQGVQGFFDAFNNNPPGWENSAPNPAHWLDKSGHGTAMARIINVVASNAKIYAFRAVEVKYARLWDVMTAIGAATAAVNPHIINLSLSVQQIDCTQCGASALSRNRVFRDHLASLSALQKTSASEPVYVAAAGNQGKSDGLFLPARYDFTMAVGAIDSNYERAAYSNWGAPPNENQKDNYLMLPGGKFDDQEKAAEFIGMATDSSGQTCHCVGTSPATALATGLLALYMERNGYNNQGASWVMDDARSNCNNANIGNYSLEEHGQGLFFWK